MAKKKILIKHFPNLNNYGTGMMGLVTIQGLADRYGTENVEFYCDFDGYTDIELIKTELRGYISIHKWEDKTLKKIKKIKYANKLIRLIYLFYPFVYKSFDKVIVLGGDDLSEYYSKYWASFEIIHLWVNSFFTRIILLGQTLGPFKNKLNRFAVKFLLPKIDIYARDPWCVEYLKNEFHLSIKQSADLALLDLPNQNNSTIEKNVLSKYQLSPNDYFTIVVSGMQHEGYYCKEENTYLEKYKEIIENLLQIPELVGKKVVLLAHTFPPYANEALLISKLLTIISLNIKNDIVLITENILQTRARFILGNGLFSITGRMHPAVSTFQMKKPAICHSYSSKYKGVIGDSIGRYDLVIESNNQYLWESSEIVDLTLNKVKYILDNFEFITDEIDYTIEKQKNIVKNTLNSI